MPGAYYNEFDEYPAQWLRNLIKAGYIADGDVDTRSIEDVHPSDLRGYTQCHFFAGIGGWSLAARRAGWPDERPLWSGSCPCQPFSAAGKGLAFDDERHLWHAFLHLIAELSPSVVVGEQVASAAVDDWIDLVHADLEALGYAFGSVPFPSAGCGSPQLRDRNYWGAVGLADSNNKRLEGRKLSAKRAAELITRSGVVAGFMGHASGKRCREAWQSGAGYSQWPSNAGAEVGSMADAQVSGRREERAHAGRIAVGDSAQGFATGLVHGGADNRPGPTNGFWREADWLGCTDGKWRPVEPGTFPLADGVPGRVGRLRAYGNSINPEAGREFLEALMECMP